MPSIQDERSRISRSFVQETCPQCGSADAVCSGREGGEGSLRLLTCPRCGFSESSGDGETRRWKGYGVFVLESGPGVVKAGTFPRAIPDNKVSRIVERFHELGSSVRYVTRWNDRECRVEVLLERGKA